MTDNYDIIKDFLVPTDIEVQELSPTRSKIILEPLEQGFGHTLGNALRRIMLSSMPGTAVSEVKIDGVLHEYTTIDGVQEDVVEILLNLKNVAINLQTRNEAEFVVNKKGPGKITAREREVLLLGLVKIKSLQFLKYLYLSLFEINRMSMLFKSKNISTSL